MAFSEVMADSSALGRFSLELYDSGRCMRLDAAAQRALNVMRQRTDANDAFSLYGLMNRARTAMAKRLLKVADYIHVLCPIGFTELGMMIPELGFLSVRPHEPGAHCHGQAPAQGGMIPLYLECFCLSIAFKAGRSCWQARHQNARLARKCLLPCTAMAKRLLKVF